MAHKPLDVYLNDHLAGSRMGLDLARWIESHAEGTPLGELMASIADEIEHDRETLERLMERLDITGEPGQAEPHLDGREGEQDEVQRRDQR